MAVITGGGLAVVVVLVMVVVLHIANVENIELYFFSVLKS